jgi:hypothetical protein
MSLRLSLRLSCLLAATLALPLTASAGTIRDCGNQGALCAVTLSIDGTQVASGSFQIDPSTGALIWPGTLTGTLGESVFSVLNVSGNADPILGYATSASTGGSGSTFSVSFSLPIALSGLIDAQAQVSYSLTGTTAPGAQISPLFGHVAIAQEVDTSVGGLSPLNKGVDVGDTFFCTPGPCNSTSGTFSATNQFVGNLAYDLMSVTVAFSLSANSNVGLSGFVEQQPVPEPGTVSLLGLGLVTLTWVARRKR